MKPIVRTDLDRWASLCSIHCCLSVLWSYETAWVTSGFDRIYEYIHHSKECLIHETTRFLLVPLALAGCASTANIALAPEPWRLDLIDNAPNDFEKAWQAILSMVGDYQVTFSFEETEALQAGYELRKGRDRCLRTGAAGGGR